MGGIVSDFIFITFWCCQIGFYAAQVLGDGGSQGETCKTFNKLYCSAFSPVICIPNELLSYWIREVLQLLLRGASLHSFLKCTELYVQNQILCNTEVPYTLFTAAHETQSEIFHPKQVAPMHLFINQSQVMKICDKRQLQHRLKYLTWTACVWM